jgi:serine/threonine protein kinase
MPNRIKCILMVVQVAHIRAEKETLKQVDHPFLVNMYSSFQDEECVYLVMEYVPGGEFFSHLKQRRRYRVVPPPQKKITPHLKENTGRHQV